MPPVEPVPHVYVLELACDGCQRPDEVITAPDHIVAFEEAGRRGWTFRGHLVFCPTCNARPQ